MRRILFLAFFLGLGFALYAQSTGASSNAGALPGSRSPNTQVTVTPGPQGLPIVNSSASAWPLGSTLGENLDYWLNGMSQAGETGEQPASPSSPNPPASQSRTSNQTKPVFEPPPMGGLPSFGAPRPNGQPSAASGPDLVSPSLRIRRDLQNSPAPEKAPAGKSPQSPVRPGPQQNGAAPGTTAPGVSQSPPQNGRSGEAAPVRVAQAPRQEGSQAGQAPAARRNGTPAAAQGTSATSKTPVASGTPAAATGNSAARKVIEVPSPVHYDRAGRRVIDPSWQESMYRMIQAEKQASSRTPAQEEGQAAEQNGNQGAREEAPVRETVIVVPGPATWRIRGTLTVARGMLALEDREGVLWYLPGLDRYIGFIDGLDAGEEAALEGYAPPQGSSQERYFQPVRLFIDEMAYDLTIPPYGIGVLGSGGQTTVIRETERRGGNQHPDDWDDQYQPNDRRPRNRGERSRREPAARPAWEHKHSSPWAPPTSVLDFKVDHDSFWRDDPAKQEQRERDSREIWY